MIYRHGTSLLFYPGTSVYPALELITAREIRSLCLVLKADPEHRQAEANLTLDLKHHSHEISPQHFIGPKEALPSAQRTRLTLSLNFLSSICDPIDISRFLCYFLSLAHFQ